MRRNAPNQDGFIGSIGVALGLIFVLGLLFFIFCFRTVGAGQVGIVTRFGEVQRVQTSGVAIKLPYPIERMEKMEVRVQKEEQTATAASKDLQDVNANLALNYALDNESALRVYKELGKDYKNRVIVPALQESFKSATAEYTVSELITKRPEVKGKAYDNVKERLGKYGIRVVDLNIVNFNFSPQFNAAIESTQVANQEVAKAKQELEKAKVDANKAITAAQGNAEAQRLQQQSLTPLFIENRKIDLQWQALQKWNGTLPNTVAGDGNILSVPIR